MAPSQRAGHTVHMLDLHTLNAQDLHGLSAEALIVAAEQMLQRIGAQSKQLDERDQHIAAQAQTIRFKDAKLEKITFELGVRAAEPRI